MIRRISIVLLLVALMNLAMGFTPKSRHLSDIHGGPRRPSPLPVATSSNLEGNSFNALRGGGNLYKSYMDLLDRKPLITKSVTAGIVSAIGDVLSQWIEAKVANAALLINWVRLATFFLCGTLYVGPFVHLWYEQLWKMGRWMERNYKSSQKMQTLAQLVVDQTVGVILFFPTYFYVYECLEAFVAWRVPVLAVAHKKCMEQISSVLIMQYYIWPLANWINFSYVPENLRVFFGNIVAIFWNAYLCTLIA